MIKLTEFTSVVDTYKKNFDIRSKRFSDKKKKDTVEKIDKRENRIETKKFLGGLKGAAGSLANKMKPGGDILDTVIRFGAFTLLGLIVKNIDKIAIAVKTIIEKLKEFAVNAKKFFEEKVVPFLKDVYNLGKDIFNIFVGIGDFVIGMNPFKEFDSEFNIIIRGILGLASKLGQLNAPKGEIPGSTSPVGSNVKKPTKTPAPVKVPVRERARAFRSKVLERAAQTAKRRSFAQRLLSRNLTPAGVPVSPGAGIPAGAKISDPLVFETYTRQLEQMRRDVAERKAMQARSAKDAAAMKRLGIEGGKKGFDAQVAQIMDDDPIKPGQRVTSLEKLIGKPPADVKRAPGFIQKGKNALGDFMKSLRSKVDNTGNALKKLGATKIPGIGLLDKVPMSARKFLGKSLRLLGLFLLAREVEQDLRNGDVNAAVVKLSAYGLGWLVTASGLLVGSALGVSGVGTVAGVAVLAGSIGAGAGTEALIRKTFLKEEKEKEKEPDSTPAKVIPKVPAVVAPEKIPNITPNPNKRADEDNYDSGGNKIRIGDTVGYDISRGLNSSTTYDNQGRFTSREVLIALQPIEKEVPVPVEIG
jgi:hypothetical protein